MQRPLNGAERPFKTSDRTREILRKSAELAREQTQAAVATPQRQDEGTFDPKRHTRGLVLSAVGAIFAAAIGALAGANPLTKVPG